MNCVRSMQSLAVDLKKMILTNSALSTPILH